MNGGLEQRLERSVEIQAPRATVFRYFTDSARWAKWWGAGSTIDARPGGKVYIRYPNGVEVTGEVVDIAAPERIVFTYGYASGQPIEPGASRVTIQLEPRAGATHLHLIHEFSDPAVRDQHVQGWRFQLSLFANVVADEVFGDAASIVDRWFEAWAVTDDQSRRDAFGRVVADDVRFHDRFSCLRGLAELAAHSGAAQRFMPGVSLKRRGDVRHCQGTIIAEWVTTSDEGKELMSGLSVLVMQPDGLIANATSLANAPAG